MPVVRCSTCGKVAPVHSHRPTTTQRGYGWKWQKHSTALRKVSDRCAICGTTRDLTVDHLKPIAHGGGIEHGTRVLCRPCNSRRGAAILLERPSP